MSDITITPDPCKVGSPVTICYDFTGNPESPIDLFISFDRANPPGNFEFTFHATNVDGGRCITVTVPAGARGLRVVDESGYSEEQVARVES